MVNFGTLELNAEVSGRVCVEVERRLLLVTVTLVLGNECRSRFTLS